MIIDSQIWKYDIRNELKEFQIFMKSVNFNENEEDDENDDKNELAEYNQVVNKVFIKLQKFTIYSSIIIRKLIEADKISDELLKHNFTISSFQKISGDEVTKFNAFEIEDLYDLDNPKKSNINLKNLTDRIIHSFHFIPKYNWSKYDSSLPDDDPENWKNDGLEGFYFSSDRTKDDELSLISLKKFYTLLEDVLRDFIVKKIYIDGKLKVNSKNNAKSLPNNDIFCD